MNNQDNTGLAKRICVLGLGYIGLPTAGLFAESGYEVIGVDINQEVIETINSGGLHIQEPGLQDVIQRARLSGRFRASTRPEIADIFIIAVPTPINPDKSADMRAVKSATETIIPFLRRGNLVILESTSPPRTTVDLIKPILEKSGQIAGKDFLLAYSPERVLPGQILKELTENDRVIGGVTKESAEAGRDVYRSFVKGAIMLTDATTAEMIKLMENTYRDVNIAIANEFSRLADRFGVDIWEAIEIANHHPRVKILNPGPGVGGHCISVDPWFLVDSAPDLAKLTHVARQVNDAQPEFVVKSMQKIEKQIQGRHVAILGLAFKADVDDLRESPAIVVAQLLRDAGCLVKAYDPYKLDFQLPGVEIAKSLEDVLKNVEIILLLVGHQQFLTLHPQWMAEHSPARKVFDAVNGWKSEDWKTSGFQITRLGVGK